MSIIIITTIIINMVIMIMIVIMVVISSAAGRCVLRSKLMAGVPTGFPVDGPKPCAETPSSRPPPTASARGGRSQQS